MNPVAAPPRPPVWTPKVLACLAATWLVWGSTYLAIKYALQDYPPFLQMGSRFLAAGALLLAWQRWRGAAWPSARQWRHALWVGTLMLGGGMGGTAYAEQTIGSGLIVVFIAVVPVLMSAASAWVLRVYPTPAQALGVAVGLLGVVMLTQGAGFQASTPGLVAIALACVAWTIGSLMSQRGFELAPGATGFASEMLAGGAVLMLVSFAVGETGPFLQAWPPGAQATAAWAYLVLAGSLLAFNAYMVLLASTPPAVASSYCFVNPVIALLLGVGIAGETVTAYEWTAAAVVLAGVVLLLRAPRPA